MNPGSNVTSASVAARCRLLMRQSGLPFAKSAGETARSTHRPAGAGPEDQACPVPSPSNAAAASRCCG